MILDVLSRESPEAGFVNMKFNAALRKGVTRPKAIRNLIVVCSTVAALNGRVVAISGHGYDQALTPRVPMNFRLMERRTGVELIEKIQQSICRLLLCEAGY